MTSLRSIDRARMIRRSWRCFIFGLIGAVPFFGLSMAWLAFRLRRDIMQETGEQWESRFPNLVWLCGIILIGIFFFAGSVTGTAATAIIFVLIQACLLHSQYHHDLSGEWNPARSLVYLGVALAYVGIVLSIIIAALGLVALSEVR